MRRIAFGPFFILIVSLGISLCGCDVKSIIEKELAKQNGVGAGPQITLPDESAIARRSITPEPAAPSEFGETIRIATFNIQVFGDSKLRNSQVTDILAEIVRRFDLVAVQEVRSKDDDLVKRFVERINVGGASYDHVIGPRLGRTSSKEQYAFIFDSKRIAVDRRSIYTVADPDDLLHREPFVARFRTICPPDRRPFTFNLVNIHTDPDETGTELNALDEIFQAVQNNALRDDDAIMLGDLNVDDKKLGDLGRLPEMAWVVSGEKTNTRQTQSYDNILFNRRATGEFTGNWGVLNLMAEFGLSEKQALEISDHMPVWAEFSIFEATSGPVMAAKPAVGGR